MKTVLPVDIVALGDENSYHIFVNGSIDNKRYDFLIDTGASHTIFDSTLVSKLSDDETQNHEIQSAGIQAGDLNASLGHIKKFRMGGLKRVSWTVIIIDLTHVNDLYGKISDKRVAGLIGSDFLLKHKATIDYRKKKLVLRNIRKS